MSPLLNINNMAKQCQITGKKAKSGQNVSHSKRATKRTFSPNLQEKKLLIQLLVR